MKLSEAIRLGSMIRPQGFGRYWPDGKTSCALGAAFEAGGLRDHIEQAYNSDVTGLLPPIWATFLDGPQQCPRCSWANEKIPTLSVITHLNDDHKWTREQIADWVATIEPSEASEVVPPAVVAVEA